MQGLPQIEDVLSLEPIVAQLTQLRPFLAHAQEVTSFRHLPELPYAMPAAFVGLAGHEVSSSVFGGAAHRLTHKVEFEVRVVAKERAVHGGAGPAAAARSARAEGEQLRLMILRQLTGFRHPAAVSDVQPSGSGLPEPDDDHLLWWHLRFSYTAVHRARCS